MNRLRGYLFFGFLALCLIFLVIWNMSRRPHDNVSFTEGELKSLAAAPLKNTSSRHRIVHFWASWCSPCRQEMPSLLEVLPDLKEHYSIYLISEDESQDLALQFIQQVDSNLERLPYFYWDTKKNVAQSFQTQLLPETFILGPDDKILRRISGSMNWKEKKNLDYLKSLPRE